MKAAFLNSLNSDLELCEIEIPELNYGQVLVKIVYSGVCSSQLMESRGYRGEDKYLPHMLGHEGAGVVKSVGDGVTKVKPGEKVVLSWIKGKGIEAGGTVYRKGELVINAGAVTTFSEYAVVSENRCFPLPSGVPMRIGALLGCAVPTGAGIIINEVVPEAGTSIGIFGLGGIGTAALMAVSLYSCEKVVAVDIEENKLEKARELGATHVINALKDDPIRVIHGITDSNGLDYTVDATGIAKSIEVAFSSVRKNGGLCIFASHPKEGDKIALNPHDLISGKQIRGSWGGACTPDSDIPKFAKLYKEGKLPLEKLLGRRYPLNEINIALHDLEHGKITRALVEM